MNPSSDQYNALMKIRSLVFNLAQEGRITNAELEDYNAAAALAFEGLEDWRFMVRKLIEEKKAAIAARDKALKKEKKLHVILSMLGLTPWGYNRLLSYPLRFLNNINRALQKHGSVLAGENHFRSIEQSYRWLQKMIDRDRRNIETIKIQKKLYANENKEVKELARQIMQQIASESEHIVDGLREGKTFDELKPEIDQYWYGELSTYNITGRKA